MSIIRAQILRNKRMTEGGNGDILNFCQYWLA